MTDNKEFAKQLSEKAVKTEFGNIICQPELWEEIVSVIERAIIPPCKVGDKVYWINHITKEIETDIVISIHQYENGLSITTDTVGTKGTTTFSLNRFLEIMHFTKEEAEEKLKECEGK